MAATTAPPRRSTTGLDLKLRRIAAYVTATQLAAELGVSRQRVSNLEATSRPAPTAVERYLAALEGLADGREAASV